MTVSPTLMPDFVALPDTPVTFRPPPGLFESPSLRPRGLSISICKQVLSEFCKDRGAPILLTRPRTV